MQGMSGMMKTVSFLIVLHMASTASGGMGSFKQTNGQTGVRANRHTG